VGLEEDTMIGEMIVKKGRKYKRINCSECGSEFEKRADRINRCGNVNLCSRECTSSHVRKQFKKKGFPAKCQIKDCEKKVIAKGFCRKHYRSFHLYGDPFKKTTNLNEPLKYEIDSNGCFICTSRRPYVNGYPHLTKNGKRKSVHRLIYEECFGEIPDGLVIRHKCDNRLCMNPEHLETGTHQDNFNDMIERGRNAFGERSGQAKLTEKDAKEIKNFLSQKQGDSKVVKFLANKYHVHENTIYCIRANRTWKHVKADE
jgi:hypothetical protein